MDSFQISDDDHMSKCLLAGIRFSCSGLLTLICSRICEKTPHPAKPDWKYILPYGLSATTIQYAFTYIALSRMDGAKGAVFDQLGVFLIVLTSGLFFRSDSLTKNKLIGCVLGFAGVIVINTEGFNFTFHPEGEGLMMIAVLCQTVSWYIAKAGTKAVDAAQLTGGGQLIGGILLTVFSLMAGGRISNINATAVCSLILLILISAVAYTLSLMPLQYFPVSEVSSFNLLITVFGVIMSAALLGENIFQIHYLLSLLLISSGILLINRRK